MFILRSYQQEAVDRALSFFKSGNPKHIPIIVAPTGAGKSVIIAHVADKLYEGVLVLQPSKELLEQNYAKFVACGGRASIYSASVNQKNVGDVTFATIGSIYDCPELFGRVKYVIIDECHLVPPKKGKVDAEGNIEKKGSMYMTFLRNLPSVKVLGLTASAFVMKKSRDRFTGEPYSQINLLTRCRPKFFNKFLHITQIKELKDAGFLAPVKYIELAWQDGELKYNSTGAEFTDESMDAALKQQKVYERLPGIIRQSIEKGRKFRVVFVKNVADAIELTARVSDSACVHSGTKKDERHRILTDFKAGKIKTIFNVGVLTVGFDFPELDTVIIARPTMSLTLYMQMVGRGMRTHPDKDDCALVDMCGNIRRFSKLEDIVYTMDMDQGMILHDGIKQLSGVRLSKIS